MNNSIEITFPYVAELTQKAWKIAQKEWPNLPREPMPVFEIKSKKDTNQLGIGYDMKEMKGMDLEDVGLKVIWEVGAQAALLQRHEVNKEVIMASIDRLHQLICGGSR